MEGSYEKGGWGSCGVFFQFLQPHSSISVLFVDIEHSKGVWGLESTVIIGQCGNILCVLPFGADLIKD